MKYRKKSEVAAWQWDGSNFLGDAPAWAVAWGIDGFGIQKRANGKLTVPTLEGLMTAEVGDWLIQGVKGEVYPCKPDVFEATYELAEAQEGEG